MTNLEKFLDVLSYTKEEFQERYCNRIQDILVDMISDRIEEAEEVGKALAEKPLVEDSLEVIALLAISRGSTEKDEEGKRYPWMEEVGSFDGLNLRYSEIAKWVLNQREKSTEKK